jgi:hypothetical protein
MRTTRLSTYWPHWAAAACFAAGLLALLTVSACRQGVPIIDTAPRPAEASGTISGTVRGPEGTSPIEGRIVEAINVTTGEREQAVTNSAGGFTFKLKPGKYRVQVNLREGEAIVKQPGILSLNRSDVDAHADFIIGSVRAARPRSSSSIDTSLKPPIA